MSVQSELVRLENAKAAIKAAIEGKGVTVPDGTLLDGMAALIESIQAGGGDSADSVIDKSVVNITSNAADVGRYAFFECHHLETVSFPRAAKIYQNAFEGCTGLTELKFPRVKTIGASDNAGGGGTL